MNAMVERSLISKLRVLSPAQVAEVEDFVEFLAAKSRKRQALDRLLAVAPAIEVANAAMGTQPLNEAEIDAEVRTLSGGNQQKVQIARWLAAESSILILIDPTRGVDVGARHDIKQIWSELAARGHAILLVSTDVEELVDTCDRVIVMSHGRRVGELAGAELNERNLMRLATDG